MADEQQAHRVSSSATASARARPARSAPTARSPPSSTVTAPSPSTSRCPVTRPRSSCASRTGARARHRGHDAARAGQGRAEGPGAPDHRAHRPHRRPQGREGHVDVPVHLEGESAPGTIAILELNTLSLEVEATHIPQSVVVSIEGLEEGAQILATDLELPKGATLITDPETLVVDIPCRSSTSRPTQTRRRRGRRGRRAARSRTKSAPSRGTPEHQAAE